MHANPGAQSPVPDMKSLKAKIQTKKAFLWDFDGCFCDTEPLHFAAYSKAFAQFGHRINEQEYYRVFTHLGQGIKGECERNGLHLDQDLIARLKKDYYWDLITGSEVRVFANMPRILLALKNQGARLAIASNSPLEELEVCLAKNSLPVSLDVVLGKLPGLRKKPAPDLFLAALDKLGVEARDALVFEDSERGLAAARAAGCEAIWLRTPQNEGLHTAEPHLVSLTHAELFRVLTDGSGTP